MLVEEEIPFVIGRRGKDDVVPVRVPQEETKRVRFDDPSREARLRKVVTNRSATCACQIDECRFPRSSAQGFDAERACARIEIENALVGDPIPKRGEDRSLHSVEGRPDLYSARNFQAKTAGGAGDHS